MGFPNVGLELCRLCALEKDNLLGIYDSDGLRLTLNAKIKKCLNIEISEKENYPKSICLDCCSKLDAFNEFLDSSINAQATLSILYADKVGRITEINYSDLEDTSKTDEEDAFMLGDVPPHVEMDIGKTEFVGPEKSNFIPDNAPQELVCCNESAEVEAQEMLPNVDSNFIREKNSEFDPLADESDADARSNRNNEEWENTSNWLCTDCSEQFNNVEDLREHHRAEHNQDARYMCEFCSKLFIDHTRFLTHLKRHKKTLKYSCGVCDKAFSNKKVCNTHKLIHSDLKPAFVCSACGKSFKQQSSLCYHSRCHLPEEVKFKYPCDLCKKRFSTRPNLLTHMRIHTGVRNFTCDQCGKSFIQKGNLEAHLLTHSNDKPYECVICNRKFKTGMQLRKHHSVHTGAKPHQCDVCGRTFREKGTLREHHRIHTGAMPFACEYCGKTFRFKGILTTHRRQHTGERPYSCFECQHHFTNWPNYNKHMKRRHGINTSRSARPGPKETTDNSSPLQQQAPAPQEVSTSAPVQQTQESMPDPTPQPQIYQEIQPADLYANMSSGLGQASPNSLPTYMAYNVYSLSHVTTMDGTTIEILPRQTISLKEASTTSGAINF